MILLGNQKMKKSKLRQIKRANNTTIVTKQVQPATDATPKKLYTCFIFTPVLVWQEKNVRSCHQWLQVTMGEDELGAKKNDPAEKNCMVWHGLAWLFFACFSRKTPKKFRKGGQNTLISFFGLSVSLFLIFPPFRFPFSSLLLFLFLPLPSLPLFSLPSLRFPSLFVLWFFSPPPPSFLFSPLPFPSIHFFLFLSSFTFCPPSLSSPAPLLQTLPPPIFFRVVFSREIGLEWSFGG